MGAAGFAEAPAAGRLGASQKQAQILRLHLELAAQPKAYVEITRASVGAFIRGMQVKAIPVRSFTSFYASGRESSQSYGKTSRPVQLASRRQVGYLRTPDNVSNAGHRQRRWHAKLLRDRVG
jgi:hypothetical protein